jgi:hypothetical protein
VRDVSAFINSEASASILDNADPPVSGLFEPASLKTLPLPINSLADVKVLITSAISSEVRALSILFKTGPNSLVSRAILLKVPALVMNTSFSLSKSILAMSFALSSFFFQ